MNKKELLGYIGIIITGGIFFDIFGFLAWVYSGQIPEGQFYIGTLTAHVLRLFI